MLAAAAVLVCVGAAGLFVIAAHFAERALDELRGFGEASLRVHGADVSPWLTFHADSVTYRAGNRRLVAVAPSGRLADWSRLRPSSLSMLLRVDTLRVAVDSGGDADGVPTAVPVTLRFPIGTRIEWNALEIAWHGLPTVRTGPASWASKGPREVDGTFCILLPAPETVGRDTCLAATADVRWSGPALRYRVSVGDDAGTGLRLSGIRDADDLDAGFDSLTLEASRVHGWLHAAGFDTAHAPRDLRVGGRVDWRADTSLFRVAWSLSAMPPVEAMRWEAELRGGEAGVRFGLRGSGARQTVDARGILVPPERWTTRAAWGSARGEMTAELRGGTWRIKRWDLPLDFDILRARLEPGGDVSALIRTRERSRVEVRWNATRPARVELDARIEPDEAWATVWTDDNIGWQEATARGVWEEGRLRAVAHVMRPRAYGASADSLTADNEVTARGYFLRRGVVYRDGGRYTGSGRVVWKDPDAPRTVNLRFDAAHPVNGRAGIVMRIPGAFTVTADSVRPARGPYDPARGLAAYDPVVDGRFTWDRRAGAGSTRFGAELLHAGTPVSVLAEADWRPDSVRVRGVRLQADSGRLEARGTVPFDGRRLRLTGGLAGLAGGSWTVTARAVPLPVAVLAAGIRDTMPWRGRVTGSVAHSPSSGLSGAAAWDGIALPWTDRSGTLRLTGLGDTLRLDAVTSSGPAGRAPDSAVAFIRGLHGDAPAVRADAVSGDLRLSLEGALPGWMSLQGTVRAQGRHVLPGAWGSLERVSLEGELTVPLRPDAVRAATLRSGRLEALYRHSRDSAHVAAMPELRNGVVRGPWHARGGGGVVTGWAEAAFAGHIRANASTEAFAAQLPDGRRFDVRNATAGLSRESDGYLEADLDADSGTVTFATNPHLLESGFSDLNAGVRLPPRASARPPALTLAARIRDFNLQRRWGLRDATAFFAGIGRAAPRASAAPSRAFELDASLEAVGTRNRIDTDILRTNFIGDVRVTGIHPYLLVNGKLTGLQGEVGQSGQAYTLRDFEVRWDNVTPEDGLLTVEGDTRLRVDCRPDTRQTCQVAVRLDGRLEEVGFTYETDCGQITGEPAAPAVLISSVAQGCYAAEAPGSEGSYGAAAFAMLEPALNQRLTREVSRGSAGFIKSTQVSGLSALLGSDSTGLESVALEVESRSVHRVGFKGRAGYHPETKLANPMEYRLAAEYRPPLEKVVEDSAWSARLRDRVTVEAAIETRPQGRDLEEERRVRQRVGLRYRYRFWDLW